MTQAPRADCTRLSLSRRQALLVFKTLSIGVLALLLAACGAPRPRHAAPPPKPEESISRPGLPPGRVYRIDENQSELRILVYRAGPLAHFGHNHVMVNHAIRGAVNLADVPGDSVFWLTVPVAGFVVDDAQARRAEGADFAGDIPEDAPHRHLSTIISLTWHPPCARNDRGNLLDVGRPRYGDHYSDRLLGVYRAPALSSPEAKRIGVPSGAIKTAAGACRSGGGISPAGEM